MTIYTPSHNEKDNAKETLVPEVVTVTVPLNASKKVPSVPEKRKQSYLPKRRRPVCLYTFFGVALVIILACGITAGVTFYKCMTKKVYSGRCGTTFYDSKFHKKFDKQPKALPATAEELPGRQQMDTVEEDIEVSEVDMFEQLHTPKFDEVMESIILHEFNTNHTSIVDNNLRRCFVMKLNRNTVAPPDAVIQLLKKLMDGFVLPKARVRREIYVSSFEALPDLNSFGPRIFHSCRLYPTFWMEQKSVGDYLFNDSDELSDSSSHLNDIRYAMLSNHLDSPTLFKLSIQPQTRGKRLAAPAA